MSPGSILSQMVQLAIDAHRMHLAIAQLQEDVEAAGVLIDVDPEDLAETLADDDRLAARLMEAADDYGHAEVRRAVRTEREAAA